MTITLHWWIFPIGLFIAPFVYSFFRSSGGDYDFGFDVMLAFAVCWFMALGILVGQIL